MKKYSKPETKKCQIMNKTEVTISRKEKGMIGAFKLLTEKNPMHILN